MCALVLLGKFDDFHHIRLVYLCLSEFDFAFVESNLCLSVLAHLCTAALCGYCYWVFLEHFPNRRNVCVSVVFTLYTSSSGKD